MDRIDPDRPGVLVDLDAARPDLDASALAWLSDLLDARAPRRRPPYLLEGPYLKFKLPAVAPDPASCVLARARGVRLPGHRTTWDEEGAARLLACLVLGLVPEDARWALVVPHAAASSAEAFRAAGGRVLLSGLAADRPLVPRGDLARNRGPLPEVGDGLLRYSGADPAAAPSLARLSEARTWVLAAGELLCCAGTGWEGILGPRTAPDVAAALLPVLDGRDGPDPSVLATARAACSAPGAAWALAHMDLPESAVGPAARALERSRVAKAVLGASTPWQKGPLSAAARALQRSVGASGRAVRAALAALDAGVPPEEAVRAAR